MTKRVGILTGGGDAPGLNAVIRAFVKRAVGQKGWSVIGVEDSFNGLMETPHRIKDMQIADCKGLLQAGGTCLGTTNRGDPFSFPGPDGTQEDRTEVLLGSIKEQGIEGLVCIGGDGTQAISLRLMEEHGVPVIGVPKTIDNDLSATDYTFGFQSAVDVATEALDRLQTTAESHERVIFLEVMGRDAGHIALSAGIAGGASVILIPEIPYDTDRVAQKLRRRQGIGRPFSVVVPACRSCAWKLRLRRWLGLLMTLGAAAAAVAFAIWLLGPMRGLLGKWAAMGIALAVLAPYFVISTFFPPAFDLTCYAKRVDYEFADESYAIEFANLNEDDVVALEG
jgi:6-phosphofructokinase